MFNVGDLVRINEKCLLEYFEGMLAIVTISMGKDVSGRQYYKVKLLDSGTKADILNHASVYYAQELDLVNGVKKGE
mgnify:FL=1